MPCEINGIDCAPNRGSGALRREIREIIREYYAAADFIVSHSNVGLTYLEARRRLVPPSVAGVLPEQNHAGSSLGRHHPCPRRRKPWLRAAVRRRIRIDAMTLDLWLAGATALGLLLYLVAVLARPERF
jgi:K+-transporting ATPase KdpF subunit